MDINFELYKIFYHAAKNESFSKAAAALFVTQSAVSQALKSLETKLGVRLFFRKTRNFKLTPEGKLLFSHIEQAYNFIKTGEQKIAETHGLSAGEVRIGASDTVCKYFLLPRLEYFNREYPRIKIRFINRTSAQIVENLKRGFLDFGVVTLPLANNSNIAVAEMENVTDIWVAAPKFTNLRDRRIPLAELACYPLLLLEKSSATRRNLDLFLQSRGIEIKPEIELESVDLLVEFARIGLGVAHVLLESAAEVIAREELFRVEVAETMPLRKLGIVAMEKVPLSRAAERLVELLSQH